MVKTYFWEKNKLLEALKTERVFEEDLIYLKSLDFTKHLVFHIGEEPSKIDFLTFINGVSYEDADVVKNHFKSGEYEIPVIHLNHLILSKLSSNRPKDKADIEELQKRNKNGWKVIYCLKNRFDQFLNINRVIKMPR